MTILCAFVLSSCGNKPSETGNTNGSNPALSTPPMAADRPGGSPGATVAEMQPARGVNSSLFAEQLRDEDARLDRLEGAVQHLRNDFDQMAPAITRLVSVEGDLQELIGQLEDLLDQENAAPAPAVQAGPLPPPASAMPPPAAMPGAGPLPAPVAQDAPTKLEPMATQPQPVMDEPQPAPAPAAAPPPPQSSGAAQSVQDIRVGEHPDKTRIVLDVNGKAAYSYDLDNVEKILIIELPGTGWSTAPQKTFSSSPIIASYRTDSMGDGGTRLILQLKSPSSVVYTGKINGKMAGQERAIIDLSQDNSAAATQ